MYFACLIEDAGDGLLSVTLGMSTTREREQR